jgi:hypothetical protein
VEELQKQPDKHTGKRASKQQTNKQSKDTEIVVGCWWLVVGCWWLVVGCRLLGVGCWLLVVDCWLLVVDCWLLVVGCWLLVAVIVVDLALVLVVVLLVVAVVAVAVVVAAAAVAHVFDGLFVYMLSLQLASRLRWSREDNQHGISQLFSLGIGKRGLQ